MKALSMLVVLLFAGATMAAETGIGENSEFANSWVKPWLSRLHFGVSSGVQWGQADNQISSAFTDAGFGGDDGDADLLGVGESWSNYPQSRASGVPLNLSVDCNVVPRVRLGAYYRGAHQVWVDGRNRESEALETSAIGARMTVLALPLKSNAGPEISFGVGAERMTAEVGSYLGWIDYATYQRFDKCPFCYSKRDQVYAANLLASVDYYFLRWLSVQAAFTAVIAESLQIPQQTFVSEEHDAPTATKTLRAHRVPLTGQVLSLGLRIHG
ncbi:hypothetical protein HZB60_03415 [candidate division KSB1 bacterium]|nr:hypothetical protein [candidate division KSB1 bacterium]